MQWYIIVGAAIAIAVIVLLVTRKKSTRTTTPSLPSQPQEPVPVPIPTPQLPAPVWHKSPTPSIDPFSYIPQIPGSGRILTVSGDGLASKIVLAQNMPDVAAVQVVGGGSITEQVVLKKHLLFDSSTYSIDLQVNRTLDGLPITDQGVFLLSDGVSVRGTWRPPQALLDYFSKGEGRNPEDPYLKAALAITPEEMAGTGTTILEPTHGLGPGRPCLEIFQALGDTFRSHTGKAANIAVMGFHIKGRQQVYDGGIRSSILFGNVKRAAAIYNYLEDTASIGITFGGSAQEQNNYADDVVAWHNVFSGVAAANIATINTENAYVFENFVRRPGHHNPVFGGGVAGYDHETNHPADHTKNIWAYNNLYDYEDAHIESAGNAIVAQDPYVGQKQTENNVNILNNVIHGGRFSGTKRFMSNGMFLSGLRGFKVADNYIFRTGQNAMQIYNVDGGVISDNIFDSTGGGGNPTVWSNGMRNTKLERNDYIARPELGINMQAGFMEICGTNNQYIDNAIPGEGPNAQPTKHCP